MQDPCATTVGLPCDIIHACESFQGASEISTNLKETEELTEELMDALRQIKWHGLTARQKNLPVLAPWQSALCILPVAVLQFVVYTADSQVINSWKKYSVESINHL